MEQQPHRKICWLDLETTGLNEYKNDIVQAGMIIEIDGHQVAGKTWDMAPRSDAVLDAKALEIIGKTEGVLRGYRPAPVVQEEIKNFLTQYVDPYNAGDKLIIGGYNARTFDVPHWRALWQKHDPKPEYYGSFFRSNVCLDVLSLIEELTAVGIIELGKSLKLVDVCKAMRIELGEDAHDAGADIQATYQIWKTRLEPLLAKITESPAYSREAWYV